MALIVLAKSIAMSLHICFKRDFKKKNVFPGFQTELSIVTTVCKLYLASLRVSYNPSIEKPVLADRVKDKRCQ